MTPRRPVYPEQNIFVHPASFYELKGSIYQSKSIHMPTNAYMFLVAGLIPLIIGAVYYHPKVAGGAWMKTNNFTEESLKGGNMAVIFGLAYLFSVLIAFIMSSMVIHQGGAFSMMYPDLLESGSAAQIEFNSLMERYGANSRSFAHGALHGFIVTVFFVLPLIGTIALFERRGWKYVLIHFIYWLICLVLMGGVICSTLQYAPLQ